MENLVLTQKQMILTSEQHAKHPIPVEIHNSEALVGNYFSIVNSTELSTYSSKDVFKELLIVEASLCLSGDGCHGFDAKKWVVSLGSFT